jgi:hypothetical protein
MAMVPDTVPVEALFIVNEALAPPDLPITFAAASHLNSGDITVFINVVKKTFFAFYTYFQNFFCHGFSPA